MSDPVTNAEIEDVLSSIRRLVSEEAKPLAFSKQEPAPAQPPVQTRPAAPDKFVLTPSLRIATDEKPGSVFELELPESKLESDPVVETTSPPAEPESGEPWPDAVADFTQPTDPVETHHHSFPEDDGESGQIDDVQPQSPESFPVFHHQEMDYDTGENEQDECTFDDISGAPDDGDHPDDVQPPEYVAATAERVSTLEQTISELEAEIDDQGGEWEPDGSEPDNHDDRTQPLRWQVEAEAGPGGAAEDVLVLEAEHEPVGAVPVEQTAVAAGDAKVADTADEDAFYEEDTSIIDEDALRDLVAEIVKEELQGALGERITRNVRKLVRREINRILTTQDFD